MIAELREQPTRVPRVTVHFADGGTKVYDAYLRFQFANAGPLIMDSLTELLAEVGHDIHHSVKYCDPKTRREIARIETEHLDCPADPLVWIDPTHLCSKGLDYAVAVALDWKEPYYNQGGIRLDKGRDTEPDFLSYDAPDPDEEELVFDHTYGFAPSQSVNMAAHIALRYNINTEFRAATEHHGQSVKAWIDDPTRFYDASTSYPVAVCHALVLYKLPNGLAVPLSFIRADSGRQ